MDGIFYIFFNVFYEEADTGGVLWKMVILKILQNWQEYTCVRMSYF